MYSTSGWRRSARGSDEGGGDGTPAALPLPHSPRRKPPPTAPPPPSVPLGVGTAGIGSGNSFTSPQRLHSHRPECSSTRAKALRYAEHALHRARVGVRPSTEAIVGGASVARGCTMAPSGNGTFCCNAALSPIAVKVVSNGVPSAVCFARSSAAVSTVSRGSAAASSCAGIIGPAARRTPMRTSSGGGVHGAPAPPMGACRGPPPYCGGAPEPGVPNGGGARCCGCCSCGGWPYRFGGPYGLGGCCCWPYALGGGCRWP